MQKSLKFALLLIVLASLLTFSAFAETTTITQAAQIKDLMDGVLPLDGDYVLGNDISLSETGGQTPIGGSGTPFSGSFDGGGHTIFGISITGTADVCGFFGATNDATIKNLTLEGSISSAYSSVGGFVGEATMPLTLEDCTNNITVSATGSGTTSIACFVGKVLSVANTSASFKNLVNNKDLTTAGKYVGGIVGSVSSSTVANTSYTFINCKNNGSVTAEGSSCIGGIIGYFLPSNESSTLEMTLCQNNKNITGKSYIGGIIGCFGNASSGTKTHATFTKLANTGDVTATNAAGGLFGVFKPYIDDIATVTNCTNMGAIAANYSVGGLIGACSGKTATLKNSFNGGTYTTESTNAEKPNLPLASDMVPTDETANNYYVGEAVAAEELGNAVAAESVGLAASYPGFVSIDWVFTKSGPEIAELHTHKIENDACTTCGFVEGCAHTSTTVNVITAATCVSTGVGEKICNLCNQSTREMVEIPVNNENHLGGFSWVAAGDSFEAKCACGAVLATASTPYIYVKDDGEGDGLTAEAPLGTLSEAYEKVAATGGTVIVVERVTVPSNFTEPAHTQKIVVTQKFGENEYRTTENCGLYANYKAYMLNGPTEFNNITFRGNGKAEGNNCIWIVAQYNPITIGEGVECVEFGTAMTLNYSPVIFGGVKSGKDKADTVATDLDSSISIASGEWTICGSSSGVDKFFSGHTNINITGGTIRIIYVGCTISGDAGSAEVNISGGKVIGQLIATQTGTLFGTYNLNLTGGDYSELIGIRGAAGDVLSILDMTALDDTVEDSILPKVNAFGKILTKDKVITNMSTVTEFASGSFEASNGITLPYRYYIPQDYETSGKNYPVFLYMHGNGSRGSDNESQLTTTGAALNTAVFNSDYDCIMIAPQSALRTGIGWVSSNYIGSDKSANDFANGSVTDGEYLFAAAELLNYFLANYRADTSRIYATGSSNGGAACWTLAAHYPKVFAAVVPIAGCSKSDSNYPYAKALTSTTIWTFHGDADTMCDVVGTREMVDAIKAQGGEKITYTEVAGAGHDTSVWSAPVKTEGFIDWIFAQTRDDFSNNLPGDYAVEDTPTDANGDGSVTVADVVLAIKDMISGERPYTLLKVIRILKEAIVK